MGEMLNKLNNQFANKMLFRRMMVLCVLIMTGVSAYWAKEYVFMMAQKCTVGVDTVAIMGAICAPVAALAGYVFKIYSECREHHDTSANTR